MPSIVSQISRKGRWQAIVQENEEINIASGISGGPLSLFALYRAFVSTSLKPGTSHPDQCCLVFESGPAAGGEAHLPIPLPERGEIVVSTPVPTALKTPVRPSAVLCPGQSGCLG